MNLNRNFKLFLFATLFSTSALSQAQGQQVFSRHGAWNVLSASENGLVIACYMERGDTVFGERVGLQIGKFYPENIWKIGTNLFPISA